MPIPNEQLKDATTGTVEGPPQVNREVGKALRHGTVYGIGNILTKALGFLMLPFYTHFLSPADYGTLEILDLVISLFGMFLNLGMTAALIRCYASAQSMVEKRAVVSTAFLFIVATAVITFCAALQVIQPVSGLILGPHVPPRYLMFAFSSFICAYIANIPRTYLLARESSTAFTIIDFSTVFIQLALNVLFIAVLKIGLVGMLLSSLFVVGVQTALLSTWLVRQVGLRFNYASLHEMVGFGLPLMISNLALYALNFSDRFFLQHLRSLDVVGIYAVGYKFGFMMNFLLVQPFYIMWQSRMYPIYAHPQHPRMFRQICVLYSLILTFSGLALSMFSPEIMHFMADSRFGAAAQIIPVVTFAYIFYGLGYYAQVGMYLTGKTALIGAISAGAAILDLLLNYVLISRFGMMGAAWATCLSFFAIAAGSYWGSQRVHPMVLGLGRVAAGLGVGVGFYLLSVWCTPNSFAVTELIKAVLLCGFVVVVWKIGILNHDEKELVITARENAFRMAARFAPGTSQKAKAVGL